MPKKRAGTQEKKKHDAKKVQNSPAAFNLSLSMDPLYVTGENGQKALNVLLVLVYPKDKKKAASQESLESIKSAWDDAKKFYEQVSYGKLNVTYRMTGWHELSEKSVYYITNKKEKGEYVGVAPNIRSEKEENAILVQFFSEALEAAKGDGVALDGYDIIACIINLNGNNGDPIRGYGDYAMDVGAISQKKLIVVDEQADWGRCAHEIAHCLLKSPTMTSYEGDLEPQAAEDIYPEGEYVEASAAGFDLMGNHEEMPLFSGYHMEKLGFYDGDRIERVEWKGDRFSNSYLVSAHGLKKPDKGVFNLIKIQVSKGLSYYVEVRQRSRSIIAHGQRSPQMFDDGILPGDSPNDLTVEEDTGGVVVTKVYTDPEVKSNQRMRFITLMHDACKRGCKKPHVLIKGDSASDPERTLRIEVKEPVNERPLVYKVEVTWDKDRLTEPNVTPVAGNPFADHNLYFNDSDSINGVTWESPDIWVEREPFTDGPKAEKRNHYWDYGWNEKEDRPNYSGDRPVKGKLHRLWARVHYNNPRGDKKVRDFQVNFYAMPPYIGDSYNYDTANYGPIYPPCRGSVKSGGYIDVGPVSWSPLNSQLTCIKAHILPFEDERDYLDNMAKEVVFDLESYFEVSDEEQPQKGGRHPEPIILPKVGILNPFDDTYTINTCVKSPQGFDVQVVPPFLTLDRHATGMVEVTIRPKYDYKTYMEKDKQYSRILIIGYIQDPALLKSIVGQKNIRSGERDHILPILVQGITCWVGIKQRVKITLKANDEASREDKLTWDGTIEPATDAKERVRVDLFEVEGGSLADSVACKTDKKGAFTASFAGLPPGHFKAKAFVVNSLKAGKGASDYEYYTIMP